jgi:outer membrane protein assembly factor BamB
MSCRPSPLIERDLLIVFTGARPKASVMALDKRTGKEVWKALEDTVSNSSPIVITAGGKKQLIVWSANALTSLHPATGETYWRELMTTSGNDSAATPVYARGQLLVSGLMVNVLGDPPATTILWPSNMAPSKRVLSNTSTPVRQGDYIYTAKGLGELICLEANTGRELWSTNSITAAKNGASINITPQEGGYFLFTDEGNLIRAKLLPSGYREISRAHLIDPTWPFNEKKFVYAPPAFANRHVFARSEAEVVCASLETPK